MTTEVHTLFWGAVLRKREMEAPRVAVGLAVTSPRLLDEADFIRRGDDHRRRACPPSLVEHERLAIRRAAMSCAKEGQQFDDDRIRIAARCDRVAHRCLPGDHLHPPLLWRSVAHAMNAVCVAAS